MTQDDEAKIVALMREARAKSRGYADYFLWAIDRDMEEWGVVTSLAESLRLDGSLFFEKLRRRGRPNDPPDCEAVDASGRRLAIEVTELVDSEAIRAYKRGKIYDWAEWGQDKFLLNLAKCLAAKDERFNALKGGPYDAGYVVVVHTDEPLLSYEVVKSFLKEHSFPPCRHVSRAFLVLSWDPREDRCPYVELRFHE